MGGMLQFSSKTSPKSLVFKHGTFGRWLNHGSIMPTSVLIYSWVHSWMWCWQVGPGQRRQAPGSGTGKGVYSCLQLPSLPLADMEWAAFIYHAPLSCHCHLGANPPCMHWDFWTVSQSKPLLYVVDVGYSIFSPVWGSDEYLLLLFFLLWIILWVLYLKGQLNPMSSGFILLFSRSFVV